MKGPSFSQLEDQYRQYLSDVRDLRPRSITNHLKVFRRFRDFLKTRRVRAARRVSLNLVYAFFAECSRGRTRASMGALHQRVGSILRFLCFTHILPRDLSRQMITPRVWKLAHIPEGLSDEELARVFAELRAETPYDHRERAMVLLLACYGLRLGEIAHLSLGDVDWRNKTIRIRERKNRVPLVLPLIPPVEDALRGYLAHFRPRDAKTTRLFVSILYKAPLNQETIRLVVKTFLHRCGLDGCASRFRHTLATRLINAGVSLDVIQAVLGHRSSDSTRIYAKVHWKALREVAENYSLLL